MEEWKEGKGKRNKGRVITDEEADKKTEKLKRQKTECRKKLQHFIYSYMQVTDFGIQLKRYILTT